MRRVGMKRAPGLFGTRLVPAFRAREPSRARSSSHEVNPF